MKQKLLLALLLVTAIASAQIVNIPDANFKNFLLGATATNQRARDISGNSMVVDANADGEIQEAEAQLVYRLNIANNIGLSNLAGIQSFTNLTEFICKSNNNLTALNVSGMVNLANMNLYNNSLTSLNLSGCTGLTFLNCGMNELTGLDLTGLTSLNELHCSSNLLTEIDLSPVNLSEITAGNNLFTTLDFSAQTELEYFNVFGCTYLSSIYLKNNHIDYFDLETFGACTSLNYICLDEGEYDLAYNAIVAMSEFSTEVSVENIEFSTICSVNGEENNNITGTVHFDFESDGCESTDPASPLVKVTSIHDGTTSSIWTSPSGYYNFVAETGDYELSLDLLGLEYFAADATVAPTISFSELNGTVVNQDFCIVPVGVHNDLEVTVGAFSAVVAGNDRNYWLIYKNNGNQTLNGTVSFTYDDGALDYVTATVPYTSFATGLLVWDFSDLQPFETRTIVLTLHANTATSTPPVLLGDILEFSFTGSISQEDETPENNQVDFSQEVMASLDPNNIVCLEGDSEPVTKIGEYLHYTINFENIGTAAANFVIVTSAIDTAKYDVSSIEILGSTHNVTPSLENNILEFRFNDIDLSPQGQGSVTYKIKSLETLTEGDSVMSQASIVFDYNEPLATNEAVTVYENTAATDEFELNDIQIYPNPTRDLVTLEASSGITEICVYDITGRLVQKVRPTSSSAVINIAAQPAGVYIVKITTDNGSIARRLIKQ
ncbi:T9SS type A sorting domain-containing protein [Flavobacterium sp. RHBU_3]|uniref:DUF7619 domain-containing protein n=1 Tax=Flavobacterium sp. RHBU_3 TaxID=3391184 RepID=UPI00398511D0